MSLSIKNGPNIGELKVDAFGNIGAVLKDVNGDPVVLEAQITGVVPVSQSGVWAVQAAQSGIWTTARSWNLTVATDEVGASQVGEWVVKQGEAGAQAWPVLANQNGVWTVIANAGTGTFNIQGEVTANPGGTFPIDLAEGAKGSSNANPIFTKQAERFVQCVHTQTGTGGALNLTIPSEIGKNIYITKIVVELYSSGGRAGNATPVAVNISNVSATNPLSILFSTATAVGTMIDRTLDFSIPARSLNPSQDVVISSAGVGNVIFSAKAFYYIED